MKVKSKIKAGSSTTGRSTAGSTSGGPGGNEHCAAPPCVPDTILY